MVNTYLGIDFGTLSARIALVSEENGEVIGESVQKYKHGVLTWDLPDWALADPSDYREALFNGIEEVLLKTRLKEVCIRGIGIDATTYSMVPCKSDGTALAEIEEYRNIPHAYIKLWKHHGAQNEAKKIEALHFEEGCFPAIDRYGHICNCEWALPKLLEVFDNAKYVFDEADYFCDLGEWIAWILTGSRVNSLYSSGYKGMWTPEYGFPDREALNRLSDGFGDSFYEKFAGNVKDYSKPCGYLKKTIADRLNIPAGIPVATPMGDGSAPGVYFCSKYPDALAITLGTSVAMAFTNHQFKPITGINGVLKDGIIPGYYCYDAGQPCAGDMLAWFVKNHVPSSYYSDADEKKIDIYTYLGDLANTRGTSSNKITVLDWFNGNRSILNDSSLRGSIIGLSLDTRPEDIYVAMIHGIACGMRVIVDFLDENGICFNKIIVCGGIAEKNLFFCQQYANILNREILISNKKNITALSSAILAAVANGETWEKVIDHMCNDSFITIKPDQRDRHDYENIYLRYKKYHDLLGKKTLEE